MAIIFCLILFRAIRLTKGNFMKFLFITNIVVLVLLAAYMVLLHYLPIIPDSINKNSPFSMFSLYSFTNYMTTLTIRRVRNVIVVFIIKLNTFISSLLPRASCICKNSSSFHSTSAGRIALLPQSSCLLIN